MTVRVRVPARDREILQEWMRSPPGRDRLAVRARIVLLAADKVGTNDICRQVGVSRPTVVCWKRRYATQGVGGLQDRTRPVEAT